MNIKNLLILIVGFLIILPVTSQEQEISKKGLFNIGVEGGVQFTNIRDFSPVYNVGSGIGYNIGGFAEYYLLADLKIRGGLYLDNRVFKMDGSFPFIDSTGKVLQSYYLYQADYKLNYLTIPVNIIYQKGSDKFKVVVQAGIFYSIYLNTKIKGGEDIYIAKEDYYLVKDSTLVPGHNETLYSGTTKGLTSSFYSPETYRFSTSDFGLSVQIGFLWNITRQIGLNAGFNFSFGLMNLFENPEIDSKWSKINRINLGFIYTLKKKAARRSHNPGR